MSAPAVSNPGQSIVPGGCTAPSAPSNGGPGGPGGLPGMGSGGCFDPGPSLGDTLGNMGQQALQNLASQMLNKVLAVKDTDPMALAVAKHLASQFGMDALAALQNPAEFMKNTDLLFNGVKSTANVNVAWGKLSASTARVNYQFAVRRTDPSEIADPKDPVGVVIEGNDTVLTGGLPTAGKGHAVLGMKGTIAQIDWFSPNVLMGASSTIVIPDDFVEESPEEAGSDASSSTGSGNGGGGQGGAGGGGNQGCNEGEPGSEDPNSTDSSQSKADRPEVEADSPVAEGEKPLGTPEKQDRMQQIRREIGELDTIDQQARELRDAGILSEEEYRRQMGESDSRRDALFNEHHEIENNYDWPDSETPNANGRRPYPSRELPDEPGLESPLFDPIDLIPIGAIAKGALLAAKAAKVLVVRGASKASKAVSTAAQAGAKVIAGVRRAIDKALRKHKVSPKRRGHILDGDKTGGGHRHGTGKPNKSEFPRDWDDDKVIDAIEDVANDPNAIRKQLPGGREIVNGTRDGVDIKVVIESPQRGGGVVTGYPTNTPRNPK